MPTSMPRLSLRADAGIGTAAVSPNSRDVALVGRSGLYIVDLHDPFALPRWLPLRSAWEVSSVQWCPHPDRPAWVVSSSNQKALVWNLALQSDRAVEHVLHGHRRAVTDIDFSPHHPDQLATASIDTTVRVWDLRKTGRSVMTFADFHAGSIQARWSINNDNQLASAHDNRLVLWDKRKANLPVFNFEAHQGECNGVQFLANGKILTCSTDRTIKIWDPSIENEALSPELAVEAGFPVWRALPTPFELGALVSPLRGGDNSLRLINLARKSGTQNLTDLMLGDALEHPQPVGTAAFMRSDLSSSHYDIITWSHDSHLRQWDGGLLLELPHASSAAGCKDDAPPPLEPDARTFNACEFDTNNALESSHNLFELPVLNRRTKDEAQAIAQLDWIAGVRLDKDRMRPVKTADAKMQDKDSTGTQSTPSTATVSAERLSQEIIGVSSRFPRVTFGNINIGAGICDFNLYGPWGVDNSVVGVFLNARIPAEYPQKALKITVQNDADLREGASDEMTAAMQDATLELSRHGVPSLEFCVRYLVGDVVSIEDALAAEAEPVSELKPDSDMRISPERDDSEDSRSYLDPQLLQIDDGAILDDDFDDSSDSQSSRSSTSDTPNNAAREANRNIHSSAKHAKRDDIIDSTPVPKNCGAVWSVTGQLVCFFNHKPVGKDKGPLPLDKIFADDRSSEDSNAPFLSDSEDFEQEASLPTTNWSVTAAQLTANPAGYASAALAGADISGAVTSGYKSRLSPVGNNANGRKRSHTNTSRHSHSQLSDQGANLPQNMGPAPTHSVQVRSMLHLWPCRPDVAAEYSVDISKPPLKAAEHNARVAAKYELWEDEHIWKMLCAYIIVEENESLDRNSAIASEAPKFDWCGGSTGLAFYLPSIAKSLEQQGKIQLLACMSIILSSLRSRRAELRRMTLMTRPTVKPLAVIDPQVQVYFQGQADGTFRMLPSLNVEEASVYSKEMSPMDPVGSTAMSDVSWLDPDLSGLSFSAADNGNSASDAGMIGGRRQSAQAQYLLPGGHQNPGQSLSPNHETMDLVNTRHTEGPIMGIEIDSHVFDLDSPPSSYIVRKKSSAHEDFLRWLPRLLLYRNMYGSLLRAWGLYIKCAEITKLNPNDPLVQDKRNDIVQSTVLLDAWVHIEASINASCALCNTPVTHLFEYCDKCSHILHSECAQRWWELGKECPSACGCNCKKHVSI